MDKIVDALVRVLESDQFGRFMERFVAVLVAMIAVRYAGAEFAQLITILLG